MSYIIVTWIFFTIFATSKNLVILVHIFFQTGTPYKAVQFHVTLRTLFQQDNDQVRFNQLNIERTSHLIITWRSMAVIVTDNGMKQISNLTFNWRSHIMQYWVPHRVYVVAPKDALLRIRCNANGISNNTSYFKLTGPSLVCIHICLGCNINISIVHDMPPSRQE